MNRTDKTIIMKSLAYNDDPSFWGWILIKEYLKKLKEKCHEVKITSTIHEIRNRIFNWIDVADKDLQIFYHYNHLAEAERPKTMELLQLPVEIKSKIERHIQEQKNVEYNPYEAGTWENPKIVYLNNDKNIIEVWLAIKAGKISHKNYNSEAIEKTLIEKIEVFLKKDIPDIDEIDKISIAYTSFYRIINICKIDLGANRISISTDQPKLVDPDDDERIQVKPEERLDAVLKKAFESFSIPEADSHVNVIRTSRRITTSSLRNISARETAEILLLPCIFEVEHPAGDLSENALNKFSRLTTPRLNPIVSEYYRKHGTFVGFLEVNQNLDAETNGTIIKHLRAIEGIEATGVGFIIFLFNKDMKLESVKITCNITTGTLRVIQEKGSDIHERVHEELDKLFS